MDIIYRKAKDTDAPGLIRLVSKCYAGYEGCILDVDAEEPQLNYIATYFSGKGGEFWVAELDDETVGSIGYTHQNSEFELKHLYVDGEVRRRGIASSLCQLVETAAATKGVQKIKLWTDTRFQEAHNLYERRGFTGKIETRVLKDLSNTTEYYYEKSLRPM